MDFNDEVGLRNEKQDEDFRNQLFEDCYNIKILSLHDEQKKSLEKGAFCIMFHEETLNKGELFALEDNKSLKYFVKNFYKKKIQDIMTIEMFKIMSAKNPNYNFNEYVNVVFGNKFYENNNDVYLYYIEEFTEKIN